MSNPRVREVGNVYSLPSDATIGDCSLCGIDTCGDGGIVVKER